MPDGSDRVPDALARRLSARGWTRLTPVQRAVLEIEPVSADMLVTAPTGSGKTVAYGLAVAHRFLATDGMASPAVTPRAMVVTPTRELAMQVSAELAWLYGGTGVRVGCLCGGVDMRGERAALRRGLDVIVGTPGRLTGHITRGTLDLSRIACVILDEADDMLDMGFRTDLETILGAMPPDRQTLMFTATITPRLEALANPYLRAPVRLDLTTPGGGHADIAFEVMHVASIDLENAVVNTLLYHDADAALVFCNRRSRVEDLAGHLGRAEFRVAVLSGALDQDARTAAIASMRSGRARVCVATDVAARGLDLPGCTLVIHADPPRDRATLLHRSGRTGRAGRPGKAILLVPHAARRRTDALIVQSGIAMKRVAPPCLRDIERRERVRICGLEIFEAPPTEVEREIAAALVARHGAERVAAAFWRQCAAMRPKPRLISGTQGPAGIWFEIDRGRRHHGAIGRILPLVCRLGRISRGDILRHRLLVGETLFQIRGPVVARFAAAIEECQGEGFVIRSLGETVPRPAEWFGHGGAGSARSQAESAAPPPPGFFGPQTGPDA